MNYALFDEAGKFLAGRVLSTSDGSIQVELDSGKRVKVKSANVLLRFEQPSPAQLLTQAQQLAAEIDLDLAWEFAPEDEFGYADLAREYFSADAGHVQHVAALLRLFDAPHYFRRAGKGRFRKASEETVKAALLGIERKRQQTAQITAWADEIVDGICPQPVREQIFRILFKPDKNALEYRAVVEAARRAQRSPLDLLKDAGAIASPYQFHWRRFLFEQFPKGTGFPPLPVPMLEQELPLAEVAAFSIDDSATTEIDDALSLQGLGSGSVVLGIHIAAPALAISPDSPIDRVARERLSTVYLPGWKLTMLPDEVVDVFTLTEGRACPAVSLYVTLDEQSLEIRESVTRVERVPIVANLRHDRLDAVITEASLQQPGQADYPFAAELAFCFRFANELKARRERVRGKPEVFSRPDYNFRLDNEGQEPSGHERVSITTRRRGAPLDLIVAEAMILANSTWGGWLRDLGVPAIYRSQASLLPGVKVRMGTKALPHAGMGVAQYTWATSPLRRYVDLANQWQIIACVRHGNTAALAAPFRPKDAALFAVISAFDTAYSAYNDFQRGIERFWTLRWLEQEGVDTLDAAVMKEGWARAETLPLVFHVPGAESLPRGAHVRVRVAGIDLLTLDLHVQLVQRLTDQAAAEDTESDSGDADEDGEGAGPLTLAIAVDDSPEPTSGGESAPGA